jgi:lysophospholipase L1-like esterase
MLLSALALALVAAGCIHETEYSGNPGGQHVVVIGDSITNNSAAQLHEALDGDHQVKLSGIIGATIADQQIHADEYAATEPLPAVVVVDLGTNDAWQAVPTETSATEIDTMIGKFPDACIVLTTVNEHVGPPSVKPTKDGRLYSNELAAALNVELRAKADVVIEWDAQVNIDPGLYLKPDTIHPTPEGAALLGELIDDAIGACA